MGLGALEPPHLLLILAIVLVIFGPGKLPQLGKALGDGIRELKHATNADDAPSPTATAAASHMCPTCKASVPPTDRFCGACGAGQSTAA